VIKVRNIALALLCGTGLSLHAQTPHEFSFDAGGGLSALRYKVASPLSKNAGGGGGFGLGYAYTLTEQWSVATGLDFNFYRSAITGNGAKSYLLNLTDDEGERYDLRTTLTRYKEKQRATYLHIPLMAVYHGPWGLYARGGVKIGIPLGAKFEANAFSVSNRGYYPLYENDLKGPQFMGFGDFTGLNSSGKLKLRAAVSLALEAGYKWQPFEQWTLYAGAYLDCGLNNVRPKDAKPFIVSNPARPEKFGANSIVISQNEVVKNMVSKIVPISAGVTLRIAYRPKPQPTPEWTENRRLFRKDRRVTDRRTDDKLVAIAELEKPVSGFVFNNADLSADIQAELDKKADILLRYPDMTVVINGHTDNSGTPEANLAVGQQRADAVKAYLVQKGVAESRITTTSKGATEPWMSNNDETSKQYNRRVQLEVQ
jgi:outer membrane protein OmpA-like peptidoglycan-associated protein